MKRFLGKRGNKPHVYVYVDRMDVARPPTLDIVILRQIFQILPEATYKMHVALTHAATKPPELATGSIPYEEWSAMRASVMKQILAHASGDNALQLQVVLVENHHRCRLNATGDPVLPNGVNWKVALVTTIVVNAHLAIASELRSPSGRPRKQSAQEDQQDIVRRLMQQQVRVLLLPVWLVSLMC
jgi:hypothetical protein